MIKIARTFANKMGLQNHQWIACTHKDTGKPHIHLIANRIGVDGKVFDTTFMSNRSAKITEEISREMGLTIAKDVRKEKQQRKQHQDAYSHPQRQRSKEILQRIAYSELRSNTTLESFLYNLERKGAGVQPVKNKQDKIYGIRFSYEGQTFKASEIGREFGYRSLANNFSFSLEQSQQQNQSQQQSNQYQPSFPTSSGIGLLLADLFRANKTEEADNQLIHKREKAKKRYYGRQL
jgi:hypothetical protein